MNFAMVLLYKFLLCYILLSVCFFCCFGILYYLCGVVLVGHLVSTWYYVIDCPDGGIGRRAGLKHQ